ncbi:uncharacterized protein LOC135151515 [Daucus carota subsp. sativus]|uniref:uncharacterized protein LOC135151515 n=1 Tax=Daucus carota subsp. sativus TaxID=79200 RepID=UPI0030835EE9
MSYEYLSNVHTGRTEWRVKVRIIREWRGQTARGEPYKGSNFLLLDAKNVRMQAFVPLFLLEKLQKMFTVGKMYTITNFQVKNYTELDKWRCVSIDKQIQFTNQTRGKEMDEKEYFIPQNCFEFCDLGDMKSLANQTTYLADVVGVVTRRDDLKLVHTKQGVDKYQLRMIITDGSHYLNVTLWGDLAECFHQEVSSSTFEEPLIIIIAAGKVGIFQDEYDLCNFNPTAYYINYNHHSVAHLRKMSTDPNFKKEHIRIIQTKKEPKLMSIQEIKQLGEDYIEEEVICQVRINTVHESNSWFYAECTTCYKQIDKVEDVYYRFGICITATDTTGDIDILLMDRPIRKLFGKTVFQMEDEEKGQFPAALKTMEKDDYTIKLEIREFNIKDKEELYVANDLYRGLEMHTAVRLPTCSVQQPTEVSVAQSSGNKGNGVVIGMEIDVVIGVVLIVAFEEVLVLVVAVVAVELVEVVAVEMEIPGEDHSKDLKSQIRARVAYYSLEIVNEGLIFKKNLAL